MISYSKLFYSIVNKSVDNDVEVYIIDTNNNANGATQMRNKISQKAADDLGQILNSRECDQILYDEKSSNDDWDAHLLRLNAKIRIIKANIRLYDEFGIKTRPIEYLQDSLSYYKDLARIAGSGFQ